MIAVIADDFTGAAEIGGIGLRNGLDVVIETRDIQPINADLLVYAADTRSLKPQEASFRIAEITRQLLELHPDFIYKKIDSVLRGNVISELLSQMKSSGKRRSVVIAANPVFKRIIREGRYYIDEIPLNETNFASDPEFPVSSSLIKEIVGDKTIISGLKPGDIIPPEGIIIGDAAGYDDLTDWAISINENTLPAGASGFFDVLLKKQRLYKDKSLHQVIPFGEKALYILGSTFPKDYDLLKKIEQNGHYLSNMPEEIYFNQKFNPGLLENWAKEIVKGIKEHKKVVASVIHTPSTERGIGNRIKENLGKLIKIISDKIELNELIIEGGSTTSVILECLNIKKLIPRQELDTGVIRMQTENRPDFCLTTKPGSYLWPDIVWLLQNIVQTDVSK